MQDRVPVDQALAAVDQSIIIKSHEDFPHCGGKPLIHGEPLPGPVHGGAESARLIGNGIARLFLPGPDFFSKFFPTKVQPVLALQFQLPFHHHLRGDTGMVSTTLPKRIVTQHTMIANEYIHQGLLECMSHVQVPGDIRRRQHDAVGLPTIRG